MNCFNHSGAPAVAICKACSKGLCAGCAVDVGGGIACRNSCEVEVEKITRLVRLNADRGSKVLSMSNPYAGAIFNLAAGLIFFYWGIVDDLSFSVALGALLIGFGIYWLMRIRGANRQHEAKSRDDA